MGPPLPVEGPVSPLPLGGFWGQKGGQSPKSNLWIKKVKNVYKNFWENLGEYPLYTLRGFHFTVCGN